VKEVKKIAKAGSKRTPHYPARCSETQGGREGSERCLYPQMREQWSSYEGKKVHIARTLRRSEEFQVMTGVRAHFAGQIR